MTLTKSKAKSSLLTTSKAWALTLIAQAPNKQMTPSKKKLALMQAKHTTLYAGGNTFPPKKMVSASTLEKYKRERNCAAELEIQSHNPANFTLGRGKTNIELYWFDWTFGE
jgi:hypothetical protein